MLLLALDTATPAVTVALHDGTDVIASSSQVDARRHGELLLPAVDRVLAEAGLRLDAVTAVVAGIGPGPYTGLRVGLMTADAFGLALGVPVHGLCTLDGLAFAADLEGPFVVATDARRKEVYWARYADSRTRLTDPAVDRPADIAEQVAGLLAVGAGALLYPDTFPGAPAGARVRRRPGPAGRREAGGGGGAARAPAAVPAPARRPGPQELQGGHPDVTEPATAESAPAVLREMRWWDIDPVLRMERELFPEDAWSRGMFWSELAHARGPGRPGATWSPRRTPASSATRAWSPPASRPTCRPSPSPATTGAPASARGC